MYQCWWRRFSLETDANYEPQCTQPARWFDPTCAVIFWCDDHKHDGDVRIEDNNQTEEAK